METFVLLLLVAAALIAIGWLSRVLFTEPRCFLCGARRGDLDHFLRFHTNDGGAW